MANELNVAYGATGLTVTAKVFNATGTQQGGNVSCTEQNSSGFYSGNMPGSITYGRYRVEFYKGAETVATAAALFWWDGAKEITEEEAVAFHRAQRAIDDATGRETVTHADTAATLAQFDLTNASAGVPTALDNDANPVNRTPV